MNEEKKTIGLITNWYPNESNPYNGCFFRDQALALKDYYNFVVIHYHYNCTFFSSETKMRMVNEEENIVEYEYKYSFPYRFYTIARYLLHKPADAEQKYIEKFASGFDDSIAKKLDVLYCVSGQREAAILKAMSDKYNIPYIVSEHGIVPWLDTVVSDRNKRAIEQADLLLAISNDKLRQIMMQGIKLPRTFYIGNYVDETRFQLSKKHSEGVKTFIFVGANVFYKNYDLFIEVMEKLVDITDVPFNVLIVGFGANKGYSLDADELVCRIKNSRFGDRAQLIPYVDHEEISNLYSQADAFIMCSCQEGQPVSAIEAGCCGLPIFSTRCGGVEDYVDDSVGRIFDVFDKEHFSEALKNYLEGRITFDKVTIREKIVSKFGRAAFIANFREVVKEVL